MLSLTSIEFALQEAFGNLVRNRLMALAAMLTAAVSLAVCAGFAVSALSIRRATEKLPQQFEMAVFIKRSTPPKLHEGLREKVQKMPGVGTVEYISQERGWKEFQKSLGTEISTEDVIYNPALACLRVVMKQPEKAAEIERQLSKMPEIESVVWEKNAVRMFHRISRVVSVGGLAAGFALLLGTILVIGNTIRLGIYARRGEIAIMRMVGANPALVRLPFVIEGMVIAGLGAVLAAVIIRVTGNYLAEATAAFQSVTRFFDSGLKPWELWAGLTALGLILGFLSSLVSIRRYLKEEAFERSVR